jgi:hypothetical protein
VRRHQRLLPARGRRLRHHLPVLRQSRLHRPHLCIHRHVGPCRRRTRRTPPIRT